MDGSYFPHQNYWEFCDSVASVDQNFAIATRPSNNFNKVGIQRLLLVTTNLEGDVLSNEEV